MKKLLTIATAGLLSFGIIGSTLQPAEAGKRERRIAAGVALGILGTAIIINESKKRKKRRAARHYGYSDYNYVRRDHYRPYRPRHVQRRVYREPVRNHRAGRQFRLTQAHVNWCFDRYRSYRQWDNTFQPYHGGRRACYSPYN